MSSFLLLSAPGFNRGNGCSGCPSSHVPSFFDKEAIFYPSILEKLTRRSTILIFTRAL